MPPRKRRQVEQAQEEERNDASQRNDTAAHAHEPATPAAPAAAQQALLRLLWISITIVPNKKEGSRLTEHDAPKVKLKACQEACAHFQDVFMPSLATGTDPKLHEAIAGLETGKRYKGAHLQTGWGVLTSLSDSKTMTWLENKVRAALQLFGQAIPSDDATERAMALIGWALRQIHVHTDPRYLQGYCYKDHLKLGAGSVFQCARSKHMC